ncbi:MAG: response regulator transcription factor [Alphaproteobacteria bacterium]|nr:response regulator transcription factor [Alphaproteobacteria bacterium]MBQ9234973.1 response regulator transcription factor [Alphaproteobacteria bacterium]
MKILIADNQALYRDGLRHNLKRIRPEAVVADAESFAQIKEVLRQHNDFDLVLADIDMSGDWETHIRELLNLSPKLRIGVMASDGDNDKMKKAQNIGLCCYLPKNIETTELTSALSTILKGGTYYPAFELRPKINNGGKKLTNRQFEVLRYLAQGLSNKQIAYYMNVSEATVKLHINALLRAIEASNRTQAVVKSQKLGII